MFGGSYYLRGLAYCTLIDFLKPNLELKVGILQMTAITAGADLLLDATC